MTAVSSLTGDSLVAVRSHGSGVGTLRNLPGLDIELESGRLFEVVPTLRMLNRIEHLGLELREVSGFGVVYRWPGGPEQPKVGLLALVPVLRKPITAAQFRRGIGATVHNCLDISVSGFGTVLVEHDLALPQSLVVELDCRVAV